MVKSVGGLAVGVLCLVLAIVSGLVFKRYIAATASAVVAIICILKAVR
ncbi:hypothetical protein [Methanobrevibacter sp.]